MPDFKWLGLTVGASLLFASPLLPAEGDEAPVRPSLTNCVKLSGRDSASTAGQIRRLVELGDCASGELSAAASTLRGIAEVRVYEKIAPAVVLVLTSGGSGSGLVLELDGRRWVLTNHHVVDDADIELERAVPRVQIRYGVLRDGVMSLVDEEINASVFKVDDRVDLALLKLDREIPGLKQGIALSRGPAPPGTDVVAIGHPKRGALWTMRPGQVSAIGDFPKDFVDATLERILSRGDERNQLEKQLKDAPTSRVLVSSCGLNPGDSGGPLLNLDGQLAAVSFAIPSNPDNDGVSLDKFSYHVDVSEVAKFLEDLPASAPQRVPDPWPPSVSNRLVDQDGNGTPDTLVCFDLEENVTGVLIDADEDSPISGENIQPENWDWEVAIREDGGLKSFFDFDNDGDHDTVLLDDDDDDLADVEFVLQNGRWSGKSVNKPFVDVSRFESSALRKRVRRLVQMLLQGEK